MTADDFLRRHLVSRQSGTFPSSWEFKFPNGYEAEVWADERQPFRFLLSVPNWDARVGDSLAGPQYHLTTEQVEAKLREIAALPAREEAP